MFRARRSHFASACPVRSCAGGPAMESSKLGAPHGAAAPEASDLRLAGDNHGHHITTTHDTQVAPPPTAPTHYGVDDAPNPLPPHGDTAHAQQTSSQAKHLKRGLPESPEQLEGPGQTGCPTQHSERSPVGEGESGADESPPRVAIFPTFQNIATHHVAAPCIENPD